MIRLCNSRSSGLYGPILTVLLVATAGCGSSSYAHPASAPSRRATGTPDQFMVGTIPAGGTLSRPQPNAGCRNPMVDPRDRTPLTLVQSQAGPSGHLGDYAVPEGRYGLRAGELLRLDCGTGRPVGFVRHRP